MPNITPSAIRNFDCIMLIKIIDSVMLEIKESVSSSLHIYTEPDKQRLTTYIEDLRSWIAYSEKVPQRDKPHSHPLLNEVPPAPIGVGGVGVDIENKAGQALLHELGTLRINVGASQSSDMPNNYMPQDASRFKEAINSVESLLVEYINKVQPLDMPEGTMQGK